MLLGAGIKNYFIPIIKAMKIHNDEGHEVLNTVEQIVLSII